MILEGVGPGTPVPHTSLRQVPILVRLTRLLSYFIEEGQRDLLPPFPGFWPLELFQHFCNVTLIAPAPTGPASSSLNLHDPINILLFFFLLLLFSRFCPPKLIAFYLGIYLRFFFFFFFFFCVQE